MGESNQNFKRLPTFSINVCDLHNGVYNDEERALYTIYGPIKRIKILGTITQKKAITESSNFEDDSMVKETNNSKSRISYQINDGTGVLWITLWGINEKNYEHILDGNTVKLIGKVRENDGKIVVYPEIVRKVTNSNEILLHELEMIRYIKQNGIYREYSKNQENIPTKQIAEFIDSSIEDDFDFNEKKINDSSESEEFDEWDNEISQVDDFEIEEKIFNLIKVKDDGNGISLDDIVKNMKISKSIVEDIIKKLCLNTKVYNTYEDTYKIFEEE